MTWTGTKILLVVAESALLLIAFFAGEEVAPFLKLERKVEKQLAWAQFTYSYSENEWCVNAQRRDASPGEYIGGCWHTLHEAEEGILTK